MLCIDALVLHSPAFHGSVSYSRPHVSLEFFLRLLICLSRRNFQRFALHSCCHQIKWDHIWCTFMSIYLFPPAFSHWAKLLCPFHYVSLIVCGLVRGTMIFSKDVILWGSLHYRPRLHDQLPVIIVCDIRERTQEERSKMRILVLPSSVTYLGDSINSWWLQNWLNFFFKLGTRLLCSPLRFTLRIR